MTSVKSVKRIKDKKCRWCKELFIPAQSMQVVCTPRCALAYSLKKKAKAFKADTAVMKKAIKDKDRAYWIKKSQIAFNAYIRARDEKLPCISCQRHHVGQYHAGHFRSIGACAALRFCEKQVWKQCAPCNNHLSGNIANYRINLVRILGADEVERIENYNEIRRFTIDELKEIEAHYKAKLKELR